MKIVFVCFLLLLVAGLGWTYNKHPEALDDFKADVTNDPNGIHGELAKNQQDFSLEKEKNQGLAETNATLTKQIQDLENKNKSLSDKLAAALAPPPAPVSAPVAAPPIQPPVQPNWTWTTSDGKTYNNVVVTKVDGDFVTILHSEGGASVQISTLPPDIQVRLRGHP
jgi:hypothetical protein